jgi:hypothetical protein
MIFKVILPQKQTLIKQEIYQAIIKELEAENPLIKAFDEIDLEGEMATLIEKPLDRIFEDFKGQIPMGGLLLSGSWVLKLKRRIKTTILKTVPSLKEELRDKIEDFDIKGLIEQHIDSYDIAHSIQHMYRTHKHQVWKLKGAAAAIGFILGLIECLLLFWLCF